jgi:hypothetical protein
VEGEKVVHGGTREQAASQSDGPQDKILDDYEAFANADKTRALKVLIEA